MIIKVSKKGGELCISLYKTWTIDATWPLTFEKSNQASNSTQVVCFYPNCCSAKAAEIKLTQQTECQERLTACQQPDRREFCSRTDNTEHLTRIFETNAIAAGRITDGNYLQ